MEDESYDTWQWHGEPDCLFIPWCFPNLADLRHVPYCISVGVKKNDTSMQDKSSRWTVYVKALCIIDGPVAEGLRDGTQFFLILGGKYGWLRCIDYEDGVSEAGLKQTSDATSTQINNIIFLAIVYLR